MNELHRALDTILSVQALIVFGCSIAVDIVWGGYIRRTAEGRSLQAANFAVGIMLFGAVNAVSYIHNPWFLVPICTGNWLGTFWMVRNDARKKQKGD